MPRLRELPGIGMGLQPNRGVRAAGQELTRRERRRVHACVRAGRPAWDEPSARYAIEIARAQERLPQSVGRLSIAWVMWIIAAVSWLNVVLHVTDDDGALETALSLVIACGFSFGAYRLPAWERNVSRAQALNEPLLSSTPQTAEPEAPVRRDQEIAGAVLAALLFGVPFGIAFGLPDESWVAGTIGGTFFGIAMVVFMRRVYRQGRSS